MSMIVGLVTNPNKIKYPQGKFISDWISKIAYSHITHPISHRQIDFREVFYKLHRSKYDPNKNHW